MTRLHTLPPGLLADRATTTSLRVIGSHPNGPHDSLSTSTTSPSSFSVGIMEGPLVCRVGEGGDSGAKTRVRSEAH